MKRYAFTIQYDGSDYHGMQLQNDFVTIQGEIEKALFTILRQNIRIHYAGRTDTGVHAIGQVIHFDIDRELELRRFLYSMNSVLPFTISFVHGQEVSPDFHARFSCLAREYIYRISNTPYRTAFSYKRSVWIRFPLNIEAMQEAASYLIGEHDFASFTKEIYVKKGEKTIRRLDAIHITKKGAELYFHFVGSGFLHNMIRIIMGTLVHVGKQELPPVALKQILEKKRRVEAGKTLPPYGLYFYRAHYEEYKTPEYLLEI
ncbi:MAG: tRNA pseudouridine(38-40) synthase TruA [Candidatus Hydrogenedentota bacterium]|nr:MAG: tRNA pseudouridine(38-40) synthase TruA [Candidatus Hydrogenedentota bacterium]